MTLVSDPDGKRVAATRRLGTVPLGTCGRRSSVWTRAPRSCSQRVKELKELKELGCGAETGLQGAELLLYRLMLDPLKKEDITVFSFKKKGKRALFVKFTTSFPHK